MCRDYHILIYFLVHLFFMYKASLQDLGHFPVKAALCSNNMANLNKKLNIPLKIFVNKSCLLSPLINFKANFEVSSSYKLATCQIEKVMSIFRSAMFCYLNRRQEFVKAGRNISTEHWSNTEKRPPEKCFGCEDDMTCSLERLYANLNACYTKCRNLTDSEAYYIRHFAPTNWYRDLSRSYDELLVLRYDNKRKKLAADFVAVLSQAEVPLNQRMFIRGELLRRLPIHSTSYSEERGSLESRLLTDLHVFCIFAQIYYYDFVIFDYEFPKQLYFGQC